MYELRDIRPLTAEIEMGDSFCGGLENLGFYADRLFLFYHQSGKGVAYYEEAEMGHSARVAFERYTNPSLREQFAVSVRRVVEEIEIYTEYLAGEAIAQKETDHMLSLMEQGWELEGRAFALYNATQPQNCSLIEAAIRHDLSAFTKSQKSISEMLNTLAAPNQLSKMGYEELDLLEIVLYMHDSKFELPESGAIDIQGVAEFWPELKRRIDVHFDKYKILMLGEGFWNPQVTNLYDDIEEKLKVDPVELRKRRNELSDYGRIITESKDRLASELGLCDETLNLCDAAAFVGQARLSLRTDGWTPLIFASRKILEELACRKHLRARELMFQTKDELRSLLYGQPLVPENTLAVRAISNIYLMVVRDRELSFYYGDEAREIFAATISSEIASEEAAIRGMSAMKGKVVGRALVYQWGDDMRAALRQMARDTILVAGQTRPQLMPLIRKAIGVITDEGGITSHAAIVARELKLPCLVGTKAATNRLRTGDLIELDADNGVAKVLQRGGY